MDKQQILASRAVRQAASTRTIFIKKKPNPTTETNPELEGGEEKREFGVFVINRKGVFQPTGAAGWGYLCLLRWEGRVWVKSGSLRNKSRHHDLRVFQAAAWLPFLAYIIHLWSWAHSCN